MNLFRPAPRYEDGDRLQIAGAIVRLRVDGRSKRVSLRLDQRAGEIIATAPTARMLGQAIAFAEERAAWMAERLEKRPDPIAFAPGMEITVAGAPCRLETGGVRGRLYPASETAPMRITAAEGARYGATVIRLLKTEARRVLTERTAHHAEGLDQPCPVVTIGDPRARWGSCSTARKGGFGGQARVGRIRYSWRLVLAPWDVMDYVAAHECAHLIEANHGPDFWALVDQRTPHVKTSRKWLKDHGAVLHAYQ